MEAQIDDFLLMVYDLNDKLIHQTEKREVIGGEDKNARSSKDIIFSQDLLLQILLRLPVDSLIRFISVQKKCKNQISNDRDGFMHMYLERRKSLRADFILREVPMFYPNLNLVNEDEDDEYDKQGDYELPEINGDEDEGAADKEEEEDNVKETDYEEEGELKWDEGEDFNNNETYLEEDGDPDEEMVALDERVYRFQKPNILHANRIRCPFGYTSYVYKIVNSVDEIVCFRTGEKHVFLSNPCTRQLRTLPHLLELCVSNM